MSALALPRTRAHTTPPDPLALSVSLVLPYARRETEEKKSSVEGRKGVWADALPHSFMGCNIVFVEGVWFQAPADHVDLTVPATLFPSQISCVLADLCRSDVLSRRRFADER